MSTENSSTGDADRFGQSGGSDAATSDVVAQERGRAAGRKRKAGGAELAAGSGSSASDSDKRAQDTGQDTGQNRAAEDGQQGKGNVPTVSPGHARLLHRSRVRDRLLKTPDREKILAVVAEMRASPELATMNTEAREQFIWAELDRMYPEEASKAQSIALLDSPNQIQGNDLQNSDTRKGGADSARVHGLGELPPGWPELPANASLAAEIGWVQANRLYVVEELGSGGTRVHLDRAHEPAPSRAAIGWLETSIRSYAKYVEVAAKATSSAQDEQDQVRRERLQLEEIRALLAEMLPVAAGN